MSPPKMGLKRSQSNVDYDYMDRVWEGENHNFWVIKPRERK